MYHKSTLPKSNSKHLNMLNPTLKLSNTNPITHQANACSFHIVKNGTLLTQHWSKVTTLRNSGTLCYLRHVRSDEHKICRHHYFQQTDTPKISPSLSELWRNNVFTYSYVVTCTPHCHLLTFRNVAILNFDEISILQRFIWASNLFLPIFL